MQLTQAEIDERLRRAAEARRTLRRATKKLMELGERALAARERERRACGDADDVESR